MAFDPLDATLPANLQGVVTREKQATEPKPKGEEIMADPTIATASLQAIDILTPDKVRAIAAELLSQKDQEKAVATKIQDLTNAGETFKADLAKAVKAGIDQAGLLATATDTNSKLTAELATATESNSKLSAELATANKTIAESGKANLALASELNKITSERAIASRTDVLTKAGMGTKALIEKFTAVAENGTLKVTDEAFTAAVAELKSVFEAGKASIAPITPAPVAGAPVEKKPEPPVQAAASDASPKAPDLSTVDAQTQAIASLASGAAAPASETGKSKYAKAFGAGL